MSLFPKLRVVFDDDEVVEIEPRARDMALAEQRFKFDFNEQGRFASIYATALACMQRLARAGTITRDLPDTPDGLMEIADIEVPDADEGKDSDPEPGTG